MLEHTHAQPVTGTAQFPSLRR